MTTGEIVQSCAWILAAISYLLLYKQQKSLAKDYSGLLSKYKEGYENLNTQLDTYKKLFSMEAMELAIRHQVAIKTPEIEQQLIERINNEGNQIINTDAIFELLGQVYKVATWLYFQETKGKERKPSFVEYITSEYPNSSSIIIWYIDQFPDPAFGSIQTQT